MTENREAKEDQYLFCVSVCYCTVSGSSDGPTSTRVIARIAAHFAGVRCRHAKACSDGRSIWWRSNAIAGGRSDMAAEYDRTAASMLAARSAPICSWDGRAPDLTSV